ncbi:MAG: hypothetical protein JO190_04840 [Candidatus Eremiobacteraeota bacterium]|nr:hypothetical protein [Candidatus Eremiobacteraeota bacterium]MBV8499598.1 hypothetical protein [Candidatus Eremiobacteraeota bacterium]
MTRSIAGELARAVDTEAAREARAGLAAAMILEGGALRRVRIFDVGDEYIALLGYAGSPDPEEERIAVSSGPNGEAASTRATVLAAGEAVVPILGAESGVVIGTLDAEADGSRDLTPDDVSFLEDCAAVLRPLYD